MGKDQLIADRYVLLEEINQVSEELKDERYSDYYNKRLQLLAKQVRSLTTAINAY